MRLAIVPAGLVVLLGSQVAKAAASDVDAFIAEAAQLQGRPLTIVTSNGPVSPAVSAELRFDGKETFRVVTILTADDGTMRDLSEEKYQFEPAEAGLTPRHFKTLFTRTIREMPYERSCDSFFFAGNQLQLDCYKDEDFSAAHAASALAFSVIWELRPDILNIRVIAEGGSATLSTKR